MVEGVQRAVACLQEAPEGLLAQLAMAFAAVFIGYMPAHHRRMTAKAFGQGAVDPPHEGPVGGGGEAVVVPAAVEVAPAVLPHAKHLGVPPAHPGRARAAGRGQENGDACPVQAIQGIRQPVEGEMPLLGLQGGPGEYAHAHQVAPRQLHQPDVLFEDIGPVQPLVGVVVASVADKRQLQFRHVVWLLLSNLVNPLSAFSAADRVLQLYQKSSDGSTGVNCRC